MKKFYPVIHCIDPHEQGGIGHALANARIAFKNGADGIFLVGHHLSHQDLFYIYEFVRKQFPDSWIGINFLDIPKNLRLLESFVKKGDRIDALWFDYLPEAHRRIPDSITLFGGVAFKYRNANLSDEELEEECLQASHSVHFATTSGDATGVPPSIEKLQKIMTMLKGKVPLALASGVTKDNVVSFLPFVDAFLVATSITARNAQRENREYFIADEVKELADLIHKGVI